MLSNSVSAAFAAVDAAVQALGALDWDALPIRDRLEALDRCETVRRRVAATGLGLVGSVERSGERVLGGACANGYPHHKSRFPAAPTTTTTPNDYSQTTAGTSPEAKSD